jgi:serine/threonine protein phosphatase 1
MTQSGTTRRTEYTYVIADIHGCLGSLQALLALLRLQPTDELVFLGDYIDRGPESRGVIECLVGLPGAPVFLKGNHEDLLLNALAGEDEATWLLNGGYTTLLSYGGRERIPESHLAFFRSLRLYHETPKAICVHAGIQPGVALADQDEEDLLWIRRPFIEYEGTYAKPIVAGHTPQAEAMIRPDRLLIDTGCFKGGPLTAMRLPDRRLFQVPSREVLALPADKPEVPRRLTLKLEEYKRRFDPRLGPQQQMGTVCKVAVLGRLLTEQRVGIADLRRELQAKYGASFDPTAFSNACRVIRDYYTTGGANNSGGTGLPRIAASADTAA